MSPKKQKTSSAARVNRIGLMFISTLLLCASILSPPPKAQANSPDCSDVFTPLSSYVTNGVAANKSFYVQAMNQTGVPWEMLAAIHYRETNFSHTNPSNGQGIFQFVNGDGGPYPPGPVSDQEFVRQLSFMASRVQNDYSRRNTPSPASVTPRALTPGETDVTLIKNTLFSYNGRASVYASQANTYGFNGSTQPYEGSPYVMNRYDCSRARMGIITRDYATGIDSVDTRYGAFTIFARLKGDAYWLQSFAPLNWSLVNNTVFSDSNRTTGFTGTPTVAPGERIYVRLVARNIGSQAWSNTSLKLGTSSQRDRLSQFYDPSWLSNVRPSGQTVSTVSPGETATIEYILKAPQKTGNYVETFALVKEGVAWLAGPAVRIAVNVVDPIGVRNAENNSLSAGEVLTKGEYLLSPDAQSSLVFEESGNVIYYSGLKKVWETKTEGSAASRLIMQPDGNLVLYNNNNSPIWYSGSSGANQGQVSLVTQPDGNLVIYSGSVPLWSIGFTSNPNLFRSVTGEMSTSRLLTNQVIETADRVYQLTLQPDGNLVLYENKRPIWATMTIGGNPGKNLRLQSDGNLVLYNSSGKPVWSTKTDGRGPSRLVMQPDGNLVLYSAANSSTWDSRTQRR